MPELKRILNEIEKSKRKGDSQLTLYRDIDYSTVVELREMGYIVVQIYIHGNIRTKIGWKME